MKVGWRPKNELEPAKYLWSSSQVNLSWHSTAAIQPVKTAYLDLCNGWITRKKTLSLTQSLNLCKPFGLRCLMPTCLLELKHSYAKTDSISLYVHAHEWVVQRLIFRVFNSISPQFGPCSFYTIGSSRWNGNGYGMSCSISCCWLHCLISTFLWCWSSGYSIYTVHLEAYLVPRVLSVLLSLIQKSKSPKSKPWISWIIAILIIAWAKSKSTMVHGTFHTCSFGSDQTHVWRSGLRR